MNFEFISFENSTDSGKLLKNGSHYYFEVYQYDRNSKNLLSYDVNTKTSKKLIECNLENKFTCDPGTNEIYQYVEINDKLLIYRLEGDQLHKVFEDILPSYEDRSTFVQIFNDNIFIKHFDNNKENGSNGTCWMFSIRDGKSFLVYEKELIYSVCKAKFFFKESVPYIVLEESYVSSYEIPELRRTMGNSEFTNNKILLYNYNQLVENIKNGKRSEFKVLTESQGDTYVSLLDVCKDSIVVLIKGANAEAAHFNINGLSKRYKLPIDISSIISVDDDLYFTGYNNGTLTLFSNEKGIIYSGKPIFEAEQLEIVSFLQNRYIVFKGHDYSEDNNYKKWFIYDCDSNDYKEYKCDFILYNGRIIDIDM